MPQMTMSPDGGVRRAAGRLPGWWFVTIRWALFPPKPKLLTAARLMAPSHGAAVVETVKGVCASAGVSLSHNVGGVIDACIAESTLTRLAAPETVMVWPRLPLSAPSRSGTSP